jgi:hypothetical protein
MVPGDGCFLDSSVCIAIRPECCDFNLGKLEPAESRRQGSLLMYASRSQGVA